MTAPTVTRLKLPAIRRYVESGAWAIHKERGLAILEQLELRAHGNAMLSAEERHALEGGGNAGQARNERKPITKSGGAIAVLPLYGVIAQRMDMMMAYCGGTSAERFADEFDAAMRDPDVSAIVIDCDSPGGSVQGTPELAKRIFDARGKGKKLIAVSNGCMASAAYWICSACDEVIGSPSSETGSIGVFTVHVDQSAMNEMVGLKYTLIKAGEHKAEGNPWEPLPADAEEFIQGQVDEMYGSFVSAVAKHRGVKAADVKANFGQGRCFTAKQALAAGMIDRVATLEDTLKSLGAKDVGMSGRPMRAFGHANATMDDQGEVVEPQLLNDNAGGLRADDGDPDPELDEPTVCPECGAPLSGGDCTSCEYRADSPSDDDDDTTENTDTTARAGGATSRTSSLPEDRPTAATEHTMSTSATAHSGAEFDAQIKAERQRAAKIRKLCQTHRIPTEQMDAMIDEGLTEDQASTRILGHVSARGAAAPGIQVGSDREADRKFASAGEQLVSVIQRTKYGKKDARLDRVNFTAAQTNRADFTDMMAGSPAGMNESVGSEGGFFIAPEVLPEITKPVYTDDPILSRVKRIPIGSTSNRTVYNVVDETARTDGNRWGGVQFFWGDEADTATAKKPKMRQVEQVLKKLIGISYLTDEMLEDAPAAQSLVMEAFNSELQFTLANAIFRAKGGGQMVGFLNGKGGIAQAIEATQSIANSSQFISQNVTKMKSNIPAALWPDLIWLYNQELLSVLMNATIGTSAVPVFVPAAGMANQGSVDRILGAPAYASELCEAPGTPGDIICIAPSQYHMAEKGGVQVATSIHVQFLTDQTALRFTQRVDGKPVWNSTVAPFKGANQRGFFSTLAVRA